MTIAISLKVHDGVVLATDSASTLVGQTPMGVGVINVYDNANKIVNLIKGMPVGIMTWGAGAIGTVSMTTIFKDLRQILSGVAPGPGGEDWTVAAGNLSIADVAGKVRRYVFEELYTQQFVAGPDYPSPGMLVAAYSSGAGHAEEYQIDVSDQGGPSEVAGITKHEGFKWVARKHYFDTTLNPKE